MERQVKKVKRIFLYLETLEREAVLGAAYKAGRNLVVLAGDTHNGWASNLRDASGSQVGVEFATPSVSSGGLETYLKLEPEQFAQTQAAFH